jgi:hypothetical protein
MPENDMQPRPTGNTDRPLLPRVRALAFMLVIMLPPIFALEDHRHSYSHGFGRRFKLASIH